MDERGYAMEAPTGTKSSSVAMAEAEVKAASDDSKKCDNFIVKIRFRGARVY